LLPALILVSCDSFFSTSWGSERSYDPDNIKLSADNLDSWIRNSIGNPKLAAALAAKIKQEVQTKPESAERLKFQEKGVELAVRASGIGTSIAINAADVLGDIDNIEEGAVKDILTKIQGDFSSGGPQAAADLASIVSVSLDPNTVDEDSAPKFTGLYAQNAKGGDVGQAVLVLSLAVLGDGEAISDAVDKLAKGNEEIAGLTLDNDNKRIVIADSSGASPQAIALAAYLNLIAGDTTTGRFDDNPLTSAIKEAFNLNT
jgi:hypothetical protein